MTKRRVRTGAATVRYDSETERVVVSCANRAEFHLPIEAFKLPSRATLRERASVTLSQGEDGIRWDVFDVDYYWPYLMGVLLGRTAWRQETESATAGVRSPAEARTSRAKATKGPRRPKGQART